MNIILLGPPGAGKGTHSQRLSKDCKFEHISTGDMLRYNVKDSTDLGLSAQAYMDAGKLVPDDLIIRMMESKLSSDECLNGFILDGYPRTISQAVALDELLINLNKAIDIVVSLDVSLREILNRMSGRIGCQKCGAVYHKVNMPPRSENICDVCANKLTMRTDDEPDTVAKRFNIYENQTKPLIEYYINQNKLVNIDASRGGPDGVYQIVKKSVGCL